MIEKIRQMLGLEKSKTETVNEEEVKNLKEEVKSEE